MSGYRYKVSGRSLAHLICLERLITHAMTCQEHESGLCEDANRLGSAFRRSLDLLHPVEQRRMKPILVELGNKVIRARSHGYS